MNFFQRFFILLQKVLQTYLLTVTAEIVATGILKTRYENEYYPAPTHFFDNASSDIQQMKMSV